MSGQKTVIIVGGGFGGLNAARKLARHPQFKVLLIDQKNHHLFQPLLYQVATAGLNVGDIAVPIRSQFSGIENVEVHWDEVTGVDFSRSQISTRQVTVHYDYLILACGSQHSYFAHPEWEDLAPGLKTLEQATEIRRRILSAFENAENETDLGKQKALLTFVIVGGGPTGVELAGAIADISRTVLIHDFRRIDPSQAQVILVEAGDRLLSAFDPELSQRTRRDLKEMGVHVRTGLRVEKIDSNGVQVGADWIPAKGVFWGAGVQAAKIFMQPEVSKDRSGRILVREDLSVPGFPNAFVIGDMAAFQESPGNWLPGLAPVAIQQGQHLLKILNADLQNRRRTPFHYRDKGIMATIGKHRAVVQAGRLHLTGFIAWLAWLFVHVFYLIGFRNRVAVLIQWAWSYLLSKRGARLITDRQWQLKSNKSSTP